MNYTQEMINEALKEKNLNELYFGIVEYKGNVKDIIQNEKVDYCYTRDNFFGKLSDILKKFKMDLFMFDLIENRNTQPVIITMIDDNIYDIVNRKFIDPSNYKLLKYDCLTDFYNESNCRLKYFTPKDDTSLSEKTILIDVDDDGKIFDAYSKKYSNPKGLEDVIEEFLNMNQNNKQKILNKR